MVIDVALAGKGIITGGAKLLARNADELAAAGTRFVDDVIPAADNAVIAADDVVDAATRQRILDIPKGQRPDPATYMSTEQIEAHLALFDGGAVRFSHAQSIEKYGTAGPDGGFVMPRGSFEAMISDAGGDLAKIERQLGFEPGQLSNGDYVPVLIEPDDYANLRVPSGNEMGANDFWQPGGYTSGGVPEAVMEFNATRFTVIELE